MSFATVSVDKGRNSSSLLEQATSGGRVKEVSTRSVDLRDTILSMKKLLNMSASSLELSDVGKIAFFGP